METLIIIADDHPLFRDAIKQAIANLIEHSKFAMAGDFTEARELISKSDNADIVLLDLSMPGSSGFSGLISIRAEFPEIPVIMVSATDDPQTIRKCLELGASGFIPKSSSAEKIAEGVQSVLGGNIWVPENIDLAAEIDDDSNEIINRINTLTPQQMRVLTMLGQGLLNKQIAYELSVSEATVKAHVSAVLLKLGVDSRTQAVINMNKISSEVTNSALTQPHS